MALSKIDVANMLTGATPVANGGTGATSFTAGITGADTWRVTTNFQGDVSPIANNWERDDSDDYALIGTGMSQSSGIFSFPETGYWQVTFYHNFSGAGDNEYIESKIEYTTDNSSYGGAAKSWGTAPGNGDYNMVTTSCIFDITNVSQDKVRFVTSSQDGNAYTQCHTGENLTYATFIRLGDT
tara:strand:- start:223 stop:771 length:549 start_codon:yes stop_codon:yes gene_type:complete